MTNSVRSLHDLDQLGFSGSLAKKAVQLLDFIVEYHAQHKGLTPTYSVMENELSLPEVTLRMLLSRLENQGKIMFVSRSTPVIMIVGEHEEKKLPEGHARPGADRRYLEAEGQRHQVARFIGCFELRTGSPPSVDAICAHFGFKNKLYVLRMIELLEQHGVIERNSSPARLTQQAREFYGFRSATAAQSEKKETKLVIIKPQAVAEAAEQQRRTRRSNATRVDQLCSILADYYREKETIHCRSPEYAYFCEPMDYAPESRSRVGHAARLASKMGYLEEFGRNTKGRLHFTKRGLRKYLPEFLEQHPDYKPREPQQLELVSSQTTVDTRTLNNLEVAIATTEEVASADTMLASLQHETSERLVAESAKFAHADHDALSEVYTGDLIVELIERGYIVTKGR